MLHNTITLIEGSKIINLTISSGSEFPDNPNGGELFYHSTNLGLYYYGNSDWNLIEQVELGKPFEVFTSTSNQTVFNTTNINTIADTSNRSYIQVLVNGVLQLQGLSLNYTVTGANQITFNTGLEENDHVIVYGL